MPPVQNTYLNTITFPGFSDNINKMYLDFLQVYKEESAGLFQVMNVGEDAETRKLIVEQDMTQFGHDKPQGVDAVRTTFGQGYSKNIDAYRYGSQLEVSYEMRVAPRFQLGASVKRFLSTIPSRMELDTQHQITFSNVTSYVNMDGRTVDTTAGDGLAYASATHPLAFTTVTWSNIVPGNPPLSVTALEAAEKLGVTDILDNFGVPVEMEFTHISVNKQDPNTVRVAMEILRSTTLVTQANPNVVNTFLQKYQLMQLSKVATDAMGRTDLTKVKWWTLLALKGMNRVQNYKIIWEAPHMNPQPAGANNGIDVYNDNWTFGARGRYGFGWVSARGAIFSFA